MRTVLGITPPNEAGEAVAVDVLNFVQGMGLKPVDAGRLFEFVRDRAALEVRTVTEQKRLTRRWRPWTWLANI